jgi:hypothetical protein
LAEFIVTLVHGTRARGAAWTQPGSAFREALSVRLGGAVQFETFEWTGRNSHEDRQEAAIALRGLIDRNIRAAPASRQLVVAHSHGGNIAIRAVADGVERAALAGIVTLATPFFAATRRDVVSAATRLFVALAWFFTLTAIPFALAHLSPSFVRTFDRIGVIRSGTGIAGWIASALVVAGCAVWLSRRRTEIPVWVENCQTRALSHLAVPQLAHTRVLSLWSRYDEVFWLFRLADRTTQVSTLFLRPWIIATTTPISIVALLPYGNEAIFPILDLVPWPANELIVYLVLPAAILAEAIVSLVGIQLNLFFPAAVVMLVFVSLAAICSSSFVVAASAHLILKVLPFGLMSRTFWDSFFLAITTEPKPRVARVEGRALSVKRIHFLLHSSIYAAPEAVEEIARFTLHTYSENVPNEQIRTARADNAFG